MCLGYNCGCQRVWYLVRGLHDLNAMQTLFTCEFQYETHSRNRQILNLCKKWGFRRSQKESLKMCKTHTSCILLRFCTLLGALSGIGGNPTSQGRKRNPNPNFLIRISSGGVGVFRVKAWGPKVRYVLRNPGKPNFLVGYSGILPGYPGGALKF